MTQVAGMHARIAYGSLHLDPGYAIGTRRVDDREYTGVLRRGRAALIECGHTHTNRDQSSRTGGVSASDCMRFLVRLSLLGPDAVEREQNQIRGRWQNMLRGFQPPASVIAQAKVDCAAAADALPAVLAGIREALS